MEFSRQEYRGGLPSPSPGNIPDPGIEPWSPALQEDSSPPEPPGKPGNEWLGTLQKQRHVGMCLPFSTYMHESPTQAVLLIPVVG